MNIFENFSYQLNAYSVAASVL